VSAHAQGIPFCYVSEKVADFLIYFVGLSCYKIQQRCLEHFLSWDMFCTHVGKDRCWVPIQSGQSWIRYTSLPEELNSSIFITFQSVHRRKPTCGNFKNVIFCDPIQVKFTWRRRTSHFDTFEEHLKTSSIILSAKWNCVPHGAVRMKFENLGLWIPTESLCSQTRTRSSLRVHYCHPILIKSGMCGQILVKPSNIRCYENPFSGFRIVVCGLMDGQTQIWRSWRAYFGVCL
jgi:hypothetical protein